MNKYTPQQLFDAAEECESQGVSYAASMLREYAAHSESFCHDVASAHALIQALEAWGKHPGYQGGESWVMKRADELMREWGFE